MTLFASGGLGFALSLFFLLFVPQLHLLHYDWLIYHWLVFRSHRSYLHIHIVFLDFIV